MRTWTFPSKSRPGTEHTTTLDDAGRFSCTCRGFEIRHTCRHVDEAAMEIGHDPSGPDPEGAAAPRRIKLMTGPYWSYKPEWGVPCRITVGSPKSFAYDLEEGLRHALAPWPPLLHMNGLEFETAYVVRLEAIGIDAIRRAIDRVSRRHPDAETLSLLCFESVWKGEQCHRRSFAAWWEQRTGEEVPEWPPSHVAT